jgi:hypothetical protein
MYSLKKSVKPEIVNRYDLWVLRHKIGGAKVFVNKDRITSIKHYAPRISSKMTTIDEFVLKNIGL